jgi:single-strand DNA-binding protein
MANLNKVILIGRLTRDVEARSFNNGGKVVKFGFAVNNRKKNQQTGQWDDEPVYLDCEAFNRGEQGKLADTIEKYCRKGSQICIEGHLALDQWNDKTSGEKRSKLKIVVDSMQLLDGRQQEGEGGGYSGSEGGTRSASRAPAAARSGSSSGFGKTYDDSDGPSSSGSGGGDEEVPF